MGTRWWEAALLPFNPRIHLCGIHVHWFTPALFSKAHVQAVNHAAGVVKILKHFFQLGFTFLTVSCLLISLLFLLLQSTTCIQRQAFAERDCDPHGSLVLLLCPCWEYWWALAASSPQRHKHFFHWLIWNKTVINKTPASLPFPHPKAKQDAEAAETLPRCVSWSVRDWLEWHDSAALLHYRGQALRKPVILDGLCFKYLINETR